MSLAKHKSNKLLVTFVIAKLLLVFGLFLHLSSGELALSLTQVFGGFNEVESLVFWELRVPRLLLVIVVGGSLAVAGVALQALFRNPLAEPGLIGVSSSAALGAVLVLVLGGLIWGHVSGWQVGLAALIMAIMATLFIYRLATRLGQTDIALMLLAGVAINAIAGALTQLMIMLADDAQLRTVIFWMMGSFSNSQLDVAIILAIISTIISLLYWRLAPALNALMLGENACLHLGYDVTTLKRQIVWGSALMVGLAVASVGVIGFVGLVVPHITRLLLGANHRLLIPFSALLGATLLVYADWVAKTIIAPSEMPIGLFMALLGGPFFLVMLLQNRKQWG